MYLQSKQQLHNNCLTHPLFLHRGLGPALAAVPSSSRSGGLSAVSMKSPSPPRQYLTATAPAQGSVITATLIFFVVVVNYIGDVVKQLMATVDGQHGGVPPGGQAAQPAALQAPPPPPDRGHVLQTGPGGGSQAEAAPILPVDAASAAVEDSADSDATSSSSSGDSPTCAECSVRRTASLTARGASGRLRRRRAGRSASARSSRGWDPMDSVFPPDGDSDSGRGPGPGDYAAQVCSMLSLSI